MSNLRGHQRGVRVVRVRPQDAASGQVRDDQSGVDQVAPGRRRTGVLRGRSVPEVLVESSGSYLRGATHSLASYALGPFRLTAAAGAIVLAVSSRGDIAILVALLAIVANNRQVTLGLITLGAGVIVNYGTGSLSALAGSQSVLGPAGLVGPVLQVVGVWTTAFALVISGIATLGDELFERKREKQAGGSNEQNTMNAPWLVALAFGASTAGLVMGPSAARGFFLRVGATILATLSIRYGTRLVRLEKMMEWTPWAVYILGSLSLVFVVMSRATR